VRKKEMNKIEPIKSAKCEQLPMAIYKSNEEMRQAAALDAREIINKAIADKGRANIILATHPQPAPRRREGLP
jgi:hypothetical protein